MEKGPGGHEREGKKLPCGIVCRDFSIKPEGEFALVSAFSWGWGGRV